MTVRFASLLAGGGWGLIAWGLGARAFGPVIWGGVVAAPFTDALTGSASRGAVEVVTQAVICTWWGITIAGFWIALWPLAYLTHIVLTWIDEHAIRY